MKMKKLTCLIALISSILVVSMITVFAITVTENESFYGKGFYTTKIGNTFTSSSLSNGTLFNINLIKGSTIVMGRETWNKGDEIIFDVSADKDIELSVGILPAESMSDGFDYNDYGIFNCKKINTKSGVRKIFFIVPETGEYGIGISHIHNIGIDVISREPEIDVVSGNKNFEKTIENNTNSKSTTSFNIVVNKIFENPLIK